MNNMWAVIFDALNNIFKNYNKNKMCSRSNIYL